jgi:hypothetical protein
VGTDEDIGKTTTCIGIISTLLSSRFGFAPDDIGYIKPVGQHGVSVRSPDGPLSVDRDAWLIPKIYRLNLGRPLKSSSPVLWTSGRTTDFISRASSCSNNGACESLREDIRHAYQTIAAGRKLVVCEGTGQSGVGSVGGISNADVIRLLKGMGVPVKTLLISRGGIGSAIDRLFPHLLTLTYLGCGVDGLILTAVRRDKLAKVKHYLSRYYGDVFPRLYGYVAQCPVPPPVMGLIPTVPQLKCPTMRLLAETFAGQQVDTVGFLRPAQPIDSADLFVQGVKVRSLESGFEAYLEDGDVFVVGINASGAIQALLSQNAWMKAAGRTGLSGLILSCARTARLSDGALQAILQSDVPTLILRSDSAHIIRSITELSVKIQPYDAAKKMLIERTYAEHLDTDLLEGVLLGELGWSAEGSATCCRSRPGAHLGFPARSISARGLS